MKSLRRHQQGICVWEMKEVKVFFELFFLQDYSNGILFLNLHIFVGGSLLRQMQISIDSQSHPLPLPFS